MAYRGVVVATRQVDPARRRGTRDEPWPPVALLALIAWSSTGCESISALTEIEPMVQRVGALESQVEGKADRKQVEQLADVAQRADQGALRAGDLAQGAERRGGGVRPGRGGGPALRERATRRDRRAEEGTQVPDRRPGRPGGAAGRGRAKSTAKGARAPGRPVRPGRRARRRPPALRERATRRDSSLKKVLKSQTAAWVPGGRLAVVEQVTTKGAGTRSHGRRKISFGPKGS